MIILKIVLIIIIAYFFFIVGPSLGGIIATTTRKNPKSLLSKDLSKGQYQDCVKEITEDIQFFDKLNKEEVMTYGRDKARLKGIYYPNGSDKTVLMFHGYRATPLSNLASSARFFHENGYNVLTVIERAHGISEGKSSTFGRKESDDVFSWLQFLNDEKHPESIVLYGTSMGATTIGYASSKITDEKVKVLILDCGYISPDAQLERDMKKRMMPSILMLPIMNLYGKLVLHVDFTKEISEDLKKNYIPAFFMHGKSDRTVPYTETLKSFESCTSEKELFLVENAGHTMSMLLGGMELKEKLSGFLNKFIN